MPRKTTKKNEEEKIDNEVKEEIKNDVDTLENQEINNTEEESTDTKDENIETTNEAIDIEEEEIDNEAKVEEIKNDVDTLENQEINNTEEESTDTKDENIETTNEAIDIEEEEIDNEAKVEEIKNDVDTDTLDEEAGNIDEMKLTIYSITYTVSQLIEMKKKPESKKTYLEKETINRFNELMYNYYRGIKWAVLKECCGKTYTVDDVRRSLNEKTYKMIDVRMSRKYIRFDKTTVDTIIKYIEDCER